MAQFRQTLVYKVWSAKGYMKTVSQSIGLIDLYVLQYVLRQITPFTHMLGMV